MKPPLASIEEVFREAAARWTLIAYFALSSFFILVFALAVNLDVVNGALAGAKLFGQSVGMRGQEISIERFVLGFESGFSGFLFIIGTFLALFATAHLVPRLQEKGTIDLYLSRPVGRVQLLLSRYLGGLVWPGRTLAYLILSMWLIIVWKTHVTRARFLLGGLVIFTIAVLCLRVSGGRRDLVDGRVAHDDVWGLLLRVDARRAREDRGGCVHGDGRAYRQRPLLDAAQDGGALPRDSRARLGRAGHRPVRRHQRSRCLRILVSLWYRLARSGGLVVFQKGLLK
jgi:hypothetical protein